MLTIVDRHIKPSNKALSLEQPHSHSHCSLSLSLFVTVFNKPSIALNRQINELATHQHLISDKKIRENGESRGRYDEER